MLQAIRNRAQGIFAWVMLILVGVPFALWGIQNYLGTGKEKPVAVVGGHEFFEHDVNRVYEQELASLAGQEYDERELKHEALDRLIREQLIVQAAEDKGLSIGDEDVRAVVQQLPFFLGEGGKFDKERYKAVLTAQNMSPNQFASQLRRSLIVDQFQKGLTESAFITEKQVESFYRLRNQERRIEYLTLPLKKFEGEISEQGIEAYYQEHQADFQNPERVSVKYVSINFDDIAAAIKPSEEELKNLYEEQKAQFTTPERRRVSHILVTFEAGKEEADKAAQDKIAKLRERISKGQEDFAKVAKEASDDKGSAEKGGDLGYVNKGTLEPNFAAAAFSLGKDELSQPIKTSFGYHLIKVTELSPAVLKGYEEAHAELVKNFQHSAAETKFYELAQTLTEQSFEHPESLDAASKSLGLKIEETELFTRAEGKGIAAEEPVRKAAFSQDVLDGKNSEAVEIGNEKVYVLHLKDHELATTKPLAEVKQAVISQLRQQQEKADSQKQAEQMLESLKQGMSLEAVAKAAKLPVNKPEAFKRMGSQLPSPLVQAVFKAPRPAQNQATPERVALENGEQVIFNLIEIKDGTIASVDPKELEMARDFLRKNQGQDEFQAYVAQMREKAKVHVKPSE